MKVASLFTGCGGLDLGLHQAGHDIILQCECDPGAQQVLRKAFPGVLLVPDVCGLERLPKETELLAAGFPCIDVSRAGLRQGLDGPSTGLVKHVFRLLAKARDEQRPVPWVLLENVEALLDRAHGGPPPVSWVVQQLEQLGYNSWAHRIVCSAGFGVPNRRRRIFILASMHGDARDVLLGQGLHRCMGSCLQATGGDCWECFDPDDAGDGSEASKAAAMLRCSYALDLGNARSAAGVDVVPTFTTSNARMCLLLSNGRFGLLRIEDAERLQGLPPGHTAPCYPISIPGIRQHRVLNAAKDSDADASARARFALLGNAVTVQVAEWIGQRLAAPYRYKYSITDNDMPLPKHQQPPELSDRVWQELREVRIDQLRGEGTAGGVARLLRGSNTAAAPADESEEEEAAAGAVGGAAGGGRDASPAAAAAAGAADADGDAAGEGSDAELDMEVALQSGDEEEDAAGDRAGSPAQGNTGTPQEPGVPTPARAERSAASGAVAAAAGGAGAAGAGTEAAGAAAVTERYGSARLTSSWPRAAWYLAEQGRWGLKQASDNPVKARFVPLGEFIKRVGPPPSDVAMVTYLQRLKEQGWNVDRTERKMLMCGVNSVADAKADANALAGLLGGATEGSEAASSIGRLVWASLPLNNSSSNSPISTGRPRTPPGADSTAAAAAGGEGATSSRAALAAAASSNVAWWPCEAIDPFNPPLGFELQPEHKLALSPEERKQYLPGEGQAVGGAGPGGRSSNGGSSGSPAAAEPKTPSPKGSAAAAAGGSADGSAAAAGADGEEEAQPSRKLLLLWFHTNSFEWRLEDEVLPFLAHKQEFKAAAQALIEAGRLPRHQDWKRAYREAKHCHTIVARAAKLRSRQQQMGLLGGPAAAAMAAAHLSSDEEGAGSSDSEGECDHRAAVAGRAAKQALAVNMKMPRCKVCEACTQNTGSSSRRCLLVRATAAAASGHGGAQLAVLADKAVGADIEVWWPLDQAWYKGVISGYDRLRVRHTVEYADGDVEIIPLWAPQQRIKLCSQPAQWVAKAAQLEEKRARRQRDVEAARAATRVAGAAGLADLASAPLTAIEQERRDNIERNRAMMQALMAGDTPAAAALAAAAQPPAAAAAVGGAAAAGGVSAAAAAAKRASKAAHATAAAARGAAAAAGGTAPAAAAACVKKESSKPPRPAVKKEKSEAAGQSSKASAAAAAPAAAAAGASAAAAAAASVEDGSTPQGRGAGLKRTAACVAGIKIKNQMDALKQQVRSGPAAKKRKQAPAAVAAAAGDAGDAAGDAGDAAAAAGGDGAGDV